MTVAIVLLAAGMSSRAAQNGSHKLLAEFGGVPLLRLMAIAARESEAASVTVVLGHRHLELAKALDGLDVAHVLNPSYASGMASSLVTGFSMPDARAADGIMVMLADMPGITSAHLNRMIEVFEHSGSLGVVRAAAEGTPGNPVILPRALYDGIVQLTGDIGARELIRASGLQIIDVELGSAALMDVDTPDAIAAAGGVLVEPSSASF